MGVTEKGVSIPEEINRNYPTWTTQRKKKGENNEANLGDLWDDTKKIYY